MSSRSESAIQASITTPPSSAAMQDHALAGQQGLAGSDVARGIGDPKPGLLIRAQIHPSRPSLWP